MSINGLGVALFLIFGGLAFWVLFFLLGFVLPAWITLGVFDKLRPKRVFEEPSTKSE
ncbi:MAG TPA: hypothetical protein PLP27_11755 [Crocinitomicaceae bacterium]|nr:hypothetical protein [Crocinitomicaceae bacterium]